MTDQARQNELRALIGVRVGRPNIEAPFEEAARKVIQGVERVVMTDGYVLGQIESELERIGFNVPLEIAAEYVARQATRTMQLPKDDSVVLGQFYDGVVVPCMQAKMDALEQLVSLHQGLTQTERMLLLAGFNIGRQFDSIFPKWWKWVVVPYRTSPLLPEKIQELLRHTHRTNQYAVLMNPDGSPIAHLTSDAIRHSKQVPLRRAFLQEVLAIRTILLRLVEELPAGEKEYRQYLLALYNALGCSHLSSMERMWLSVDKAWVRIPATARVIPVHMMEWGYLHPRCISPEFHMRWRTDEHADVIKLMRQQMRQLALRVGNITDPAKIDGVDVGTFLTIARGGSDMDFRFVGQSIPNRPKAQSQGMKVFLDGDAMGRRMERHRYTLEHCLDQATLEWVLQSFSLTDMYALVTGHEFGHPFTITNDLLKAFGTTMRLAEEGKATLLGIAGMQAAVEAREWGDKNANLRLATIILDNCLRMLDPATLLDPTHEPYVKECLMILSVLRRRGFLQIIEGKLSMSISTAASGLIPRFLYEDATMPLVQAYRERDLPEIRRILSDLTDQSSADLWPVLVAVKENLAAV